MLGPHTHTPAPTARGLRTPTAHPVGRQSGEGQRPTSDAPHNGGRHLPRGRPTATPTGRNAVPQGRTLWGRCWAPRPHQPHPGHTGCGTLAARSRGRVAGGGRAPDTRRPSQQWQASPPGDAPPPAPRHAAPTGHAGQGDRVGPPQPHTRAQLTWVGDPNSPPSGRAVGGGTAPDLRRPSQWWKAPPPGTPFRHPHSEQRRPARAHAVGLVLGPHARTDRTRNTRVAEPWLPPPEDGRGGEGQRLTPDAPHHGGRPAPPGTAPHHPRGTQPPQGMQAKRTVLGPHTHTPAPTACGWRTPTTRPVGGQSGEGQRLSSDAPHNGGGHPPPGTPFRHPHSEQRRLARAHAVGPVLGPHARTDRTRDTRVAEPWLPAAEDGRPGEGQRLTPDAPHNGGRPPPPRQAAPTGHAGQEDSVGPPHPHTRAHSTWVADPNSPPSGRAVGEGTAPDLRRPSQWWKSSPPGTPFRHSHSEQRQHARAQAVGLVLGPHARTDHIRDTRVAEPWLPAPEDGRQGEGQRLTPDAPHNGGRPSPPGDGPPQPPRHAAPTVHAGQGDSVGPPHPHTRAHSTSVADPNSPPSGRAVGGGTAPELRRPSQWWKAPPPGTPFRHPHSEQRRPARAHAVGPVLGPHARTDRTQDTWVAEPRLPAPEDGRPGEGQRLTPGASHNGGRPPPPGTAPQHPRGTQPPQGMQAKRTVLGPQTHTPAPTARGWRTPTARPVGGQSGKGQRLTSDAPHNGGRHPPRGRPSAMPTASNASTQERTLWDQCWVSTPAPTASGTDGSRNPGCSLQRTGGRGRDSA